VIEKRTWVKTSGRVKSIEYDHKKKAHRKAEEKAIAKAHPKYQVGFLKK